MKKETYHVHHVHVFTYHVPTAYQYVGTNKNDKNQQLYLVRLESKHSTGLNHVKNTQRATRLAKSNGTRVLGILTLAHLSMSIMRVFQPFSVAFVC